MKQTPEDLEGQIVALVYDLKAYCKKNFPAMPNSFYSDILTAGLEKINFGEVAETMIRDNMGE